MKPKWSTDQCLFAALSLVGWQKNKNIVTCTTVVYCLAIKKYQFFFYLINWWTESDRFQAVLRNLVFKIYYPPRRYLGHEGNCALFLKECYTSTTSMCYINWHDNNPNINICQSHLLLCNLKGGSTTMKDPITFMAQLCSLRVLDLTNQIML